MRWFYYVVLGLAIFVGVYSAFTEHWIIAGCAGAILLLFVSLPDEGL